ncbi:MAG: hypothetical protein E7395_01895 [Ruminococcaceae bacterium]|nr:hypothetical protein [Oscillospiraceae bacterium]
MKRICCLILTVCLIAGAYVSAMAQETYEAAVARIVPFNLIDTENHDEMFSRMDGIVALMRLYVRASMMPVDDVSVFSDVANENEFKVYSNYAYYQGFVSGVGNGMLMPDEAMSLHQFSKIAVSVLGYGDIAQSFGGYPDGYMSVASQIGLLKNITMSNESLTYETAVYLLSNMLDIKPLEKIWGTDNFRISDTTLYEQLMNSKNIYALSGIVEAVGKASVIDGVELEDDEVLIDGLRMSCDSESVTAPLGRRVTVRYTQSSPSATPAVLSVYVSEQNKEVRVDASDIERLTRTECVYYSGESDEKRIVFDDIITVYNGRLQEDQVPVKPATGTITALDNDNDGRYEIVFVDEYVSLIVDKIFESNHTVYFQEGYTFRGRNAIKFDLSGEKQYEFVSENGEAIAFDELRADDVISVWADSNEENICVVVSRSRADGSLIEKGQSSVKIGNNTYEVYGPEISRFMSEYDLKQSGSFGINHAGEVVGVIGEINNNNCYGYVLGFTDGGAFGASKVKLIRAGSVEKEIETISGDETIKYTYTNGEELILEFADTIKLNYDNGAEVKVAAQDLEAGSLQRSVIEYELNNESKIKSMRIFNVPPYEQASQENAYAYKLNGELNSFGGYINKPAFYVNDSTQVICVPKKESPNRDDYDVSVEVIDGSDYTVIPIAIDSKTQVAQSAVILEDMDADSVGLFKSSDDISVVGDARTSINDDGEHIYKFEVICGDEISELYVDATAAPVKTAANIKKGDLIRYRAKNDGCITDLQYMSSLTELGKSAFINNEGSQKETVFAGVTDIQLNRLDDFRNERIDRISVNINGREKKYVIPRKNGPMIYTYYRKQGLVSAAIPEEIQGSNQVGGDASWVYMIVCENEPMVVVNVVQ